jgi:hypothetical protein
MHVRVPPRGWIECGSIERQPEDQSEQIALTASSQLE